MRKKLYCLVTVLCLFPLLTQSLEACCCKENEPDATSNTVQQGAATTVDQPQPAEQQATSRLEMRRRSRRIHSVSDTGTSRDASEQAWCSRDSSGDGCDSQFAVSSSYSSTDTNGLDGSSSSSSSDDGSGNEDSQPSSESATLTPQSSSTEGSCATPTTTTSRSSSGSRLWPKPTTTTLTTATIDTGIQVEPSSGASFPCSSSEEESISRSEIEADSLDQDELLERIELLLSQVESEFFELHIKQFGKDFYKVKREVDKSAPVRRGKIHKSNLHSIEQTVRLIVKIAERLVFSGSQSASVKCNRALLSTMNVLLRKCNTQHKKTIVEQQLDILRREDTRKLGQWILLQLCSCVHPDYNRTNRRMLDISRRLKRESDQSKRKSTQSGSDDDLLSTVGRGKTSQEHMNTSFCVAIKTFLLHGADQTTRGTGTYDKELFLYPIDWLIEALGLYLTQVTLYAGQELPPDQQTRALNQEVMLAFEYIVENDREALYFEELFPHISDAVKSLVSNPDFNTDLSRYEFGTHDDDVSRYARAFINRLLVSEQRSATTRLPATTTTTSAIDATHQNTTTKPPTTTTTISTVTVTEQSTTARESGNSQLKSSAGKVRLRSANRRISIGTQEKAGNKVTTKPHYQAGVARIEQCFKAGHYSDFVSFFTEEGADPNMLLRTGLTPLTIVLRDVADPETLMLMVANLLEQGADVNIPTTQGRNTPCFFILVRLEKAINSIIRNSKRPTVLENQFKLIETLREILSLLLTRRANPDHGLDSISFIIQLLRFMRDDYGLSQYDKRLVRKINKQLVEFIRLILEHGVDHAFVSPTEGTLFHWLVKTAGVMKLNRKQENGCAYNSLNELSNTLHHVTMLILKSTPQDMDICSLINQDGQTVEELAHEGGVEFMINLFKMNRNREDLS